MEIQPIRIDPIRIQVDSLYVPPVVSGIRAPVTVDIGVPIVQMPGCVEARNSTSSTFLAMTRKVILQFVIAGVPSYDPIQYEPQPVIYNKTCGST